MCMHLLAAPTTPWQQVHNGSGLCPPRWSPPPLNKLYKEQAVQNKKVFIPNRSGHNLKAATEFGDLVIMSEGTQNILAIRSQHRVFCEIMNSSSPDDYVAMLGPGSLVALASAIMAVKHGCVNYLVFHKGVYKERNIDYLDDPS